MKIICTIDNDILKKATEIVNKHYCDLSFLDRLIDSKFNHTSDDGYEVAKKIVACTKTFYIIPYTHWNPLSSTFGHFEDPNYRLNMRKINALNLKGRVKNIFHECCGHGNGYSHKGNYVTDYNKLTVPYLTAEIFGQYCEDLGLFK